MDSKSKFFSFANSLTSDVFPVPFGPMMRTKDQLHMICLKFG